MYIVVDLFIEIQLILVRSIDKILPETQINFIAKVMRSSFVSQDYKAHDDLGTKRGFHKF